LVADSLRAAIRGLIVLRASASGCIELKARAIKRKFYGNVRAASLRFGVNELIDEVGAAEVMPLAKP
jgi:hypothetical protein